MTERLDLPAWSAPRSTAHQRNRAHFAVDPDAASYSRSMTTAVLLAFSNGGKEFIDGAHVHGFRDGHLLIASGPPGAGLDAQIVGKVPVIDLAFAETCERDDTPKVGSDGSEWSMTWPDH